MMRSFGAAALLILAIVTESLAAHSDRSRQRSSPIRSVPVAANIKRDIDFDCPEEFGYYPHPTDCTLYYVCVFGGALLESCTGGLMYSHELQTCDWPRNVGCDGTSAIGSEDLERISEREPPPPPAPRRTPPPPPPPPPRAQPNPIVTSRGQPKFNRDEYEKQQQLYAEVDDLPPVEEIESDRQQRVNRGQPPTIGQVQKDRDGYVSQVVSSGRNLNSNIIPASIQNSGKVGSFSFGTQIDDRRTAVVTQAPQAYSDDKSDNVTDYVHDRQLDIETNEINDDDIIEKPVYRKKRDLVEKVGKNVGLEEKNSTDVNKISERSDHDEIGFEEKNSTYVNKVSDRSDHDEVGFEEKNSTDVGKISERSDRDEEIEFSDIDLKPRNNNENIEDDSERGKRQIRYYVKNGYNKPGKNWAVSKPIQIVNIPQYNYNPNSQFARYPSNVNGLSTNNFYDSNRNPYRNTFEDNLYAQTADSYPIYQIDAESQRPFKASLPDPFNQKYIHNPANVVTQIITKSPPISALKNNENPFASLAGGFYNNAPKQIIPATNRPNHPFLFPDPSQLPSTVVTDKPVLIGSSPRPNDEYRTKSKVESNFQDQKNHDPYRNGKELNRQKQVNNKAQAESEDYKDRDNSSEEDDSNESSENYSSEKDEDNRDDFRHKFPEPPYEFTHPNHKYAEIENPFANPNFDFDAYLARLSNGQYSSSTLKYKNVQMAALRATNPPLMSTTASPVNAVFRTSTLNYKGMSTPKPFTVPFGPGSSPIPPDSLRQPQLPTPTGQWVQTPGSNHKSYVQQQEQPTLNQNIYRANQQSAGISLEAVKSSLRPPNFKDERQLPVTYTFSKPLEHTLKPTYDPTKVKNTNQQLVSVSQKPYTVFSTGAPIILSTPKQQYLIKPEKVTSLQPQSGVTGKTYSISTSKPNNAYIIYKHSTAKPLTTIANEQLSVLQNFWNSPSTESHFSIQPTPRPNAVSEIPKLQNFSLKPSTTPVKGHIFANIAKNPVSSTIVSQKRRPIPKPSPEMNDYYYDDEEDQYYYEPPIKSKYMPSSEVRPKRPPMAQNYREYDDNYSYEDPEERPIDKPLHTSRNPTPFTTYKPDTVSKNSNDLSVVTKASIKDFNKIIDGKVAVPVMIYSTPSTTSFIRPDISNYKIVHQPPRNRTVHMKKPVLSTSSPYTLKPPKYLNQTTLRPYTVRHRLAKPTTVKEPVTTAPTRHPNIVAQTKFTTPRDSYNQETRYTKTKHDEKTNSLEPTESISPVSYSASPRPKMLYNGSQSYSPDQYDPYYAVYDEDGELYKDTDYVQQYNTASLRPAVQQTYRGTPPSRRPVESYTPRPVSADDYDDALIQGQVNQNQYQSAIRHSTRGEGNELGYDHNPSSARTPAYEASSISTTPSTTSTTTTTTTTQRPTTAPLTEAMTPSRYTTRSESPTDENPIQKPESLSNENPKVESDLPVPPTSPSYINFSSFAKPFEKTDNIHRLKETLSSTEKLPTSRHSIRVTNNNDKVNVDVVRSKNAQSNKKIVSLTSGFSIRRNSNNTNNPYTLTVLTRPFEDYNKARRPSPELSKNKETQANIFNFTSNINNKKKTSLFKSEPNLNSYTPKDSLTQRKDASSEFISKEDDIPVFVRPSRIRTTSRVNIFTTPPTTKGTTKYYIKSAIRRPTPFSIYSASTIDSTENSINTDILIDNALQNAKATEFLNSSLNRTDQEITFEQNPNDAISESWNEPVVSPYRTLDNLRNSYNNKDDLIRELTTSTASSVPVEIKNDKSRRGPSYYSYRVVDDNVPDQTTEVFSGRVKNVIKAFFNNFVSSTTPKYEEMFSTANKITTTSTEKVVNIGDQKNTLKYIDETTPRFNNVKHLQIMTEPTVNTFISPSHDTASYSVNNVHLNNDFVSTLPSFTKPLFSVSTSTPSTTTPMMLESSTVNEFRQDVPHKQSHESKFVSLITSKPDIDTSRKFQKIVTEQDSTERSNHDGLLNNRGDESTKPTRTNVEITNKVVNEIASTTSTTKSTVTMKNDSTSTTKSLPFPTRASRVNPAIKLAATNPGGGRRSYQSTSKCSSDNSLQANPKCNEIKYQRPSGTRGRGSAHYSTLNGGDAPQPAPNRGTPPTRSRPTLKPSTAIVSKSTEFVDIYAHPPSRSAPVYPQPTPDKTAAKCRKDVCLLPDCYCGGKEIPGDLPLETVPQIVLLTFDDSVNDLNKGLYADLFEKGRVNPNGCPIAATFYVSHEWTDYSQVQNLYAAGHEMASHTISHSFGEQFSQKKWNREVGGQREILAAYGGVKLEDVRGMRAPFLSVGGNKMFKMLYDSNFTYDSSLPVYENRPPSWPYTLDYKLFHDCMIPPCPTKSYPGVWEVPMVMWQDLNGGRCSMGDACANPPEAEGVYKMILKNFDRHYTTNRAPFGLYYHAAWFTQPHHKEGFIMFLDFINQMQDVWIVTNWQAIQWVRDPTPISRLNNFQPFQCNYQDRPRKCNNPKVCNLWHKSGVRYMRTCQPCPEVYPWTGKTGIRSSRIDNDIGE